MERRAMVMGRVAESQAPPLVKVGVSRLRARRVPVGRRLARLAVPVSVWVSARWGRDGGGGWWVVSPVEDSGGLAGIVDVCFVMVGLDLRDIFLLLLLGFEKCIDRKD